MKVSCGHGGGTEDAVHRGTSGVNPAVTRSRQVHGKDCVPGTLLILLALDCRLHQSPGEED